MLVHHEVHCLNKCTTNLYKGSTACLDIKDALWMPWVATGWLCWTLSSAM